MMEHRRATTHVGVYSRDVDDPTGVAITLPTPSLRIWKTKKMHPLGHGFIEMLRVRDSRTPTWTSNEYFPHTSPKTYNVCKVDRMRTYIAHMCKQENCRRRSHRQEATNGYYCKRDAQRHYDCYRSLFTISSVFIVSPTQK